MVSHQGSGGWTLTKLTWTDITLAGGLLVVGILLIAGLQGRSAAGETVVIRNGAGDTCMFDLRADRVLKVEGHLGETAVAIRDRRVRFVSSPCPHSLCMKKGWISRSGEWIACLPNGVSAKIEGRAGYDGITP